MNCNPYVYFSERLLDVIGLRRFLGGLRAQGPSWRTAGRSDRGVSLPDPTPIDPQSAQLRLSLELVYAVLYRLKTQKTTGR